MKPVTATISRARVVIIGGGVIGCSIAYHLAHLGWTDVVVLERDRLTSGTTWHAAGLMTCFGSTSQTNTEIRLYSRELYAALEQETGQSTGFKPVGLIEAAADADRLQEYRRVAAFQRMHGLEVEEISPAQMSELFPWAKTDDLHAGFWVPGDGRVNPVDLTMALAKGARQRGVTVLESSPVLEVLTTDDPLPRIRGVRTAEGEIECEYVVNATGMWARELAERSGVVVPNQAAEHYYLITDTIDGLSSDAPIFEDPAAHGYYREEGGGMMVGLFEPKAAAWNVNGIPADFSFGTIAPDWDRMAPFLETAMARVPITQDVGVRTFFCGPESFTPDLRPAVGEAPGIANYFVAAGMNSVGVLSAGGLGRVVAQWIVDGHPSVDVTGFDVARFRRDQLAPDYRSSRTVEILGTVYAAHTPGKQLHTAREAMLTPVHERLVAAGGYMREVSGWECPDWYAGAGRTPSATPTWDRAPWFEQWEAEHRSIREDVGVIEMSFMAKFAVPESSAAALSYLCAAALDGPGRITYTQWLNSQGRLEADLTVTSLPEGGFMVVASDTAKGHVEALMRRGGVEFVDVTSDWAQFNVQGPRSRAVLAGLTDLEAMAFRDVRRLTIADVPCLLARITYQGELGYEIYVPRDHAVTVWDAIADAGVRPVGLKALASLRLEKGYRDFGHDIDNTDCPLAAGLGFAINWDKDFLGKTALAARKGQPMESRLVQVLVGDPDVLLYEAEPVLRDGEPVGYLRAASYGWTLGGAVGLAMVTAAGGVVTPDWLSTGKWEVDVAGERFPITVSLRPFYDPTSSRVKV